MDLFYSYCMHGAGAEVVQARVPRETAAPVVSELTTQHAHRGDGADDGDTSGS